MRYYKIKSEFDNRRIFKFARGGGLHYEGFLIGGELITPKEFEKRTNNALLGFNKPDCYEVVEIPKNRVYWFFGARFASEEV